MENLSWLYRGDSNQSGDREGRKRKREGRGQDGVPFHAWVVYLWQWKGTSADPTGLLSPKGKYNKERNSSSRYIDSSDGAKEEKDLSFAQEVI